MGQYYMVVNLDKRLQMVAHDYDNGVKLMEHSWIGNNFMNAVVGYLAKEWAGDYADSGEFIDDPNVNVFEYASQHKFRRRKAKFSKQTMHVTFPLLLNHDQNEYIDIRDVPESTFDGWHIHPLSLLTASGNGRGGGDYHGTSMQYVGRWAGHHLSVASEVPDGYTEIKPNFIEGVRAPV